jgi:D-serine deaminase-like pyridoxal phosphate-dependent protein
VVDSAKIARMAKPAGCCHIIVAVDQLENMTRIAEAASEAGTTVHVVIEVDVGMHILFKLNEVHGIMGVDQEKARPDVGTCVEIIPSHVCTTVNLHDRYYIVQDNQLVDI